MTVWMAAVTVSQGRLLRRISIASRPRPFRVVVLGQVGVGKSALTVRFLTRRFIGDYDPQLEKVYTCTRCVDGDAVVFEVMDTAHSPEGGGVEESIRWADAYILLYSVADRCSLNECLRLKFLINSYGKRNRKLSAASPEVALSSNPVALVGNQNDRSLDRMVPLQEGVACAAQLGCVAFYEISVRECCDSVHTIFEDLYLCHKRPKKFRAIYPRTAVTECKFPAGGGGGGGSGGVTSPAGRESSPSASGSPAGPLTVLASGNLKSSASCFRHCISAPSLVALAGSGSGRHAGSSSSSDCSRPDSQRGPPLCLSSSYYYYSSSSASSSPDKEAADLQQYFLNRFSGLVPGGGDDLDDGNDGEDDNGRVGRKAGLKGRKAKRSGQASLLSPSLLRGKGDAESAAAAEVTCSRRRDAQWCSRNILGRINVDRGPKLRVSERPRP